MAYGARLESVLGASPRGFESPILRHCDGLVRSCRSVLITFHSLSSKVWVRGDS